MDAQKSTVLPYRDLARMLPGKPTADTVAKWARTGRLSVSGVRVKLKRKKLTCGYGSSFEWYEEFIERLQT